MLNKKQTKQKQKQIEMILRYLDEFEEIDNGKARELLVLPDEKNYLVSRLFSEMKDKGLIEKSGIGKGKNYYRRKKS